MIEFDCGCGRHLKVRPDLAGRFARCPQCGATVPVPDLAPSEEELQPGDIALRPERVRKPPYEVWVALVLKAMVILMYGAVILSNTDLAVDLTVAFPAGLSILVVAGLATRTAWGWWLALVVAAAMVGIGIFSLNQPPAAHNARIVGILLEPGVAALLIVGWWRGAYDSD